MDIVKYSIHPNVVQLEQIRANVKNYVNKYNDSFQEMETDFPGLCNYVLKHVWAPSLFDGGRRLKASFQSSEVFALDFDTPGYSLAQAKLDWADSVHIIATSKSHGLPKDGQPACDRFRIVSIWERPITDLKEFEFNITKLINNYNADPACKDGARYFFPCEKVVSFNADGYRQPVVDIPSFSIVAADHLKAYHQDGAAVGGRNNFLISHGGKLRNEGVSKKEIREILTALNLEKNNPPLPGGEMADIFKSVFKFDGFENVDDIPTTKPERTPAKKQALVSYYADETKLKKCFDLSSGLVREIADTILKHAVRPYEHFALASALQIISGVAQGAVTVPSLDDTGSSGGSLCLYQWLSAPSAAGKDCYRRAVELYLGDIDQRLLCPNIGSNMGLRSALYAMNSTVSVIDEMQDEMERLAGPKASSHLTQVLTDMKVLTSAPKFLKAHVVKGAVCPSIDLPRYGVFGVGTSDGLIRHLKGDLIRGGLLSRFTVWLPFRVRPKQGNALLDIIPYSQIERLKRLFEFGLTEHGRTQDYLTAIKEFNQCTEGKTMVPHKIQTEPGKKVLAITAPARMKLIDFTTKQEIIYIDFTNKDLSGTDLSPGSIADRAPAMAIKFAALHALGRESWTIETPDVEFGISLAKTLSGSLCDLVAGNAGDSETEKQENKILQVLRAQETPVKKTVIHRAMTVRDLGLFNKSLLNLWVSGKLTILNALGVPVSPDDQKEIPRGGQFVIAE